jgi:hypothetical protein
MASDYRSQGALDMVAFWKDVAIKVRSRLFPVLFET